LATRSSKGECARPCCSRGARTNCLTGHINQKVGVRDSGLCCRVRSAGGVISTGAVLCVPIVVCAAHVPSGVGVAHEGAARISCRLGSPCALKGICGKGSGSCSSSRQRRHTWARVILSAATHPRHEQVTAYWVDFERLLEEQNRCWHQLLSEESLLGCAYCTHRAHILHLDLVSATKVNSSCILQCESQNNRFLLLCCSRRGKHAATQDQAELRCQQRGGYHTLQSRAREAHVAPY
jgi:hypothetical protein